MDGAAATALKSWDSERGSCTGAAASASSFRPSWLLQRRCISCNVFPTSSFERASKATLY